MSDTNEQRPQRFVLSDAPATFEDDLLIGATPGFAGRLRRIADDILRAAGLTSAAGASYAVHGRWGRGKSTAARYLQHLLEAGGPSVSVRYVHLPNLVSDPSGIRASLGYALLEALSKTDIEQLASALGAEARTIPTSVTGTDRERELRRCFYDRMLSDDAPFFLDALVEQDLGRHGPAARVLILDEIDRCTPEQTAALLRSIDYWLRAPLVFFVLVCDREHLLRSIESQATHLDRTPEEAIQKYVHHAVDVPDLLASPLALRRYIEGLLTQIDLPASERDLIVNNLPQAEDDVSIALLDPLVLWSEDRHPRSVKQTVNVLVAAMPEVVAAGGEAALKRLVISYRWPEFYAGQVEPVLAGLADSDPRRRDAAYKRADWLDDLAEVGRRAFHQAMLDWGRTFAAASTKSLADRQRVDVQDLPGDLILYLGTGPNIVPPREDPTRIQLQAGGWDAAHSAAGQGIEPIRSLGDPAADVAKRDETASDLKLSLRAAVLEAELARRQGTPRAALQILQQVSTRLEASSLGEGDADIAGEAAVEAELSGGFELAWALYRRAIALDPTNLESLTNALDLLVKLPAMTPEQLELGSRWVDEARMLLDGETSLMRLRMLERFYRAIDRTEPADELRKVVLERGMVDASYTSYRTVASILNEEGRTAELFEYSKQVLRSCTAPIDAYAVLRGFADHLIAHTDDREPETVAIYLDLFRSGLGCIEPEEFGNALNNLAILATQAAPASPMCVQLWELALANHPTDPGIRTAFARYLSSENPDRATEILRGGAAQPQEELDLASLDVLFDTSRVDRWWEQELRRLTVDFDPCIAEPTGSSESIERIADGIAADVYDGGPDGSGAD